MYKELLGHPGWKMYDIIGVLGCVWIVCFFLFKSTWSVKQVGEKRPTAWVALPLLVHLIAYTFGGTLVGPLLGRNKEFFGYFLVSAVAMVLAAVVAGANPRRWLDDTAPLYATLAAGLKIGCFCAGCCHGLPWAYGLYNHQTERAEFPIQLVEMVLYGLLLMILLRHRFAPGRRFAAFLVGYAAVRFMVQFFRTDKEVFSSFHWISAAFLIIGLVCWYVLPWLSEKNTEQENTDT